MTALNSLRRNLLPLCDLVTPNLPEAETLSGIRIRSDADRRLAAGLIAEQGARAVLVKGGHARGSEVRDLLFDGRFFTEFVAPRIRTRATHGTGCTLSAAIAANLALGRDLEEAVLCAIQYLRAGLARGRFAGRGWGIPDHFPERLTT
jgi:hydroxymethylpyrimidine/phosphomethylpyrimidine kinase